MHRLRWQWLLMMGLFGWIAGCATSPEAVDERDDLGNHAPKHYVCRRAPGPIAIDGRLDDAAWSTAAWTDAFVDIEGEDRAEPRFETRAKMLWDDEYLYIGARLQEPHIWATLTERDEIVFYDNDFEIFIDPDGDAAQYYEIEVNALGTIFDLFLVKTYIDGGPALHDWDLKGMKHAVHIGGTLNNPTDLDAGWSIEFALPWAHLAPAAHMPAPPEEGDIWRINFSRVQWRHRVVDGRYQKLPGIREDNWVWSPQGAVNMHLPQRWGFVQFTMDGEKPDAVDSAAGAVGVPSRALCLQRDDLERPEDE